MDHNARCAFVVAQAACVHAEIAAMQAENAVDIAEGKPPRWSGVNFRDLTYFHVVGHNAVIEYLAGA